MTHVEHQNARLRNERGETLVTVMIAAGLVGLIMLGVASSITSANKGAAAIEQQLAASTIAQTILNQLSDSTACMNTIGAVTLAEGKASISSPASVKNKVNEVLYSAGSNYENNRIHIDSFTFGDYDQEAGSTDGTAQFRMKLTKAQITPGPQVFNTPIIQLRTKRDTSNKLIWCRAFGVSESLWKAVGNGDIYYDGGKVGIGTTVPKSLLDLGATQNTKPIITIGRNDSSNDISGYSALLFGGWRDVDPNYSSAIVAKPAWTCCGWPGAGYAGIKSNDIGIYPNFDPTGTRVYDPAFVVKGGGDIGIGTTAPSPYTHGGTNRVMEINNPGTTQHSQAHVILSSNAASQPNSSIGTLTWALPTSTNATSKMFGWVAMQTGATSTAASPTTQLTISTTAVGETAPSDKLTINERGEFGFNRVPSSTLDIISRRANGAGDAIQLNKVMPDDSTQDLIAIHLVGLNAAKAQDWYWSMYTADPDGGFGVGARNLEFWEYPMGAADPNKWRPRFIIESSYGYAYGGTNLKLDRSGNTIMYGNANVINKLAVGSASAPLANLDVTGFMHVSGNTNPSIQTQGAFIGWNARTGGTGETDFINHQGGGTGGFSFYNTSDTTKGTELVFINGSGDMRVIGKVTGSEMYATSFHASSDRNLKTDIEPLEGSLEKILSLEGVSYKWRDPKASQERQLGVIAQDVSKVFPEVVAEDQRGFLAVAYHELLAPLIEAFKEFYQKWLAKSEEQDRKLAEQARLIEEQKARIELLERETQRQRDEFQGVKDALCELRPKLKACELAH